MRVPCEVVFLPDGRAIFTERTGQIRMIVDHKVLPVPLLQIPVAQGIKMGMLGNLTPAVVYQALPATPKAA